MSYTLKMKKIDMFPIREKPTQAQTRRRLGPIPIINLQPHQYRKWSQIKYKPTPRSKVVEAMIIEIAVVNNGPAYMLDNGQWIFQHQIKG